MVLYYITFNLLRFTFIVSPIEITKYRLILKRHVKISSDPKSYGV